MIRNASKLFLTFFRITPPFSTYRTKGDTPFRSVTEDMNSKKKYAKEDAEKVYDQFVKQNPSNDHQPRVSGDHPTTKKQESFSFDPYQVLGLKTGASKEKINQAYRELALKYHPKNDSSAEASQEFIKITRAYEMLNPIKKTDKKSTIASSAYMAEFNNLVKDYIGIQTKPKEPKHPKSDQHDIKDAQLYSQKRNVKKVGNRQQVTITKEYNKNGKVIKIEQVEDYMEDGTVEVTENYNDGTESKVSKFTRNTPNEGKK